MLELLGIVLAVLVGVALLLRWRRPVWYWLTFGVTLAMLRVRFRYATTMEACRLTMPASRMRRALARWAGKPVPPQRVPRLLWIRPTRTGVRLRIRLWPGQDAFEFSAASDRLRHSFAVHQVTSREIKPGVIELTLTGYDVLKRVQMPATPERDTLKIPLALVEDGTVHYRDYREVPHSVTVGATMSGKSVTQRTVIKELAAQHVALVGIDCKKIELGPFARRFSALADNPDDAMELLEALVARMEGIYDVIRIEQRISADTPDGEIAANIWDLPEPLRPVPIVVTIDEIAELTLSTKKNDPRRDRIVKALVRLAQLGRGCGNLPGHLRPALRLRTRRRDHHAPRPVDGPDGAPRQRRVDGEDGLRGHLPARGLRGHADPQRPARHGDRRLLDRRMGAHPHSAHLDAAGRVCLQPACGSDPGAAGAGLLPPAARSRARRGARGGPSRLKSPPVPRSA
ncbi:S-DNA-T family DNA segregation ATPase FtsK/SpoIIIE [Streptomyces canus]|nr:S-DNA-T family DNA segregation ATPase FtsK/SpoIIIE [Streptomyces canus]